MDTLHAHVVFTAKYRRHVFDDDMLRFCGDVMRKVCEDFDATLTELGGETDHVHLLVHCPPKGALSVLVNSAPKASAHAGCARSSPAVSTGP